VHLLILAKEPLPGRAKTRLAPRFGPEGSARLAAAALADTLDTAAACRADRVVVAFDGRPDGIVPAGVDVIPQVAGDLGDRLAAAWEAAGAPGLQIGMDTPHLGPAVLDDAYDRLRDPSVDAVLGPAADGGWWAIGFRTRPRSFAEVFAGIPASTPDTGARQLARLRELGLRTELLATHRDVDEPDDVAEAARVAPASRFGRLAVELGAAR